MRIPEHMPCASRAGPPLTRLLDMRSTQDESNSRSKMRPFDPHHRAVKSAERPPARSAKPRSPAGSASEQQAIAKELETDTCHAADSLARGNGVVVTSGTWIRGPHVVRGLGGLSLPCDLFLASSQRAEPEKQLSTARAQTFVQDGLLNSRLSAEGSGLVRLCGHGWLSALLLSVWFGSSFGT
jgi:hypothetical protein